MIIINRVLQVRKQMLKFFWIMCRDILCHNHNKCTPNTKLHKCKNKIILMYCIRGWDKWGQIEIKIETEWLDFGVQFNLWLWYQLIVKQTWTIILWLSYQMFLFFFFNYGLCFLFLIWFFWIVIFACCCWLLVVFDVIFFSFLIHGGK